jgi:hypothetical protein
MQAAPHGSRKTKRRMIFDSVGKIAIHTWTILSLPSITTFFCENRICPIAMGRTLYSSFRILDKHWDLSFDVAATRAKFAGQRHSNPLGIQIVRTDLPRSVGHHLLGGQDPSLVTSWYCQCRDTCRAWKNLRGRMCRGEASPDGERAPAMAHPMRQPGTVVRIDLS